MSAASLFRRVCVNQIVDFFGVNAAVTYNVPKRYKWTYIKLPKPGVGGKSFRRIVHFEDKYTIKPLEVTNLAGRDPVTGRVVVKGYGGGIKHKYHWIYWKREGPTDLNEKPKEEKVLRIFKDGCRTAFVALVGSDRQLKYILATQNMKEGDIIRTHMGIPRNAVRPNEGDAYPLGALPAGTVVNCVEKYPGIGGNLIHAAGSSAVIVKRDEKDPNLIVLKMPTKKLFLLNKACMATVGRLSNTEHSSIKIGSAQKLRELGYRPRSGLFKKKTGRFGPKLKKKNKYVLCVPAPPKQSEKLLLNNSELN
ncbi:mitochondrial ribosomal protein L2 [Nomia melanderi]|uniref:mitochondrial ribosomal protein L2 n=1 Tax=Nomia melanderi TaxID=2448451 RepID=UPI00130424F2|nr:39S ribosomal protein L2, mitochondrial [Nomia melanderi]